MKIFPTSIFGTNCRLSGRSVFSPCSIITLHEILYNWFSNDLLLILFLAVGGLCCCVQAFSSSSEWGLHFFVVHELLITVAFLVVEHRLSCSVACGIFLSLPSSLSLWHLWVYNIYILFWNHRKVFKALTIGWWNWQTALTTAWLCKYYSL